MRACVFVFFEYVCIYGCVRVLYVCVEMCVCNREYVLVYSECISLYVLI